MEATAPVQEEAPTPVAPVPAPVPAPPVVIDAAFLAAALPEEALVAMPLLEQTGPVSAIFHFLILKQGRKCLAICFCIS